MLGSRQSNPPLILWESSMGHPESNLREEQLQRDVRSEQAEPAERLNWETPRMEDVSEQVMAQPYIRFT
jgi:hypothetical protein